jgi:hypothetical protein
MGQFFSKLTPFIQILPFRDIFPYFTSGVASIELLLVRMRRVVEKLLHGVIWKGNSLWVDIWIVTLLRANI